MDKGTTMASYTASIGTAAGGLMSLNNIALILGLVFAALTFYINWRSQAKRIELKEAKRLEDAEYHRARMAALLYNDNSKMMDTIKTTEGHVERVGQAENERV